MNVTRVTFTVRQPLNAMQPQVAADRVSFASCAGRAAQAPELGRPDPDGRGRFGGEPSVPSIRGWSGPLTHSIHERDPDNVHRAATPEPIQPKVGADAGLRRRRTFAGCGNPSDGRASHERRRSSWNRRRAGCAWIRAGRFLGLARSRRRRRGEHALLRGKPRAAPDSYNENGAHSRPRPGVRGRETFGFIGLGAVGPVNAFNP